MVGLRTFERFAVAVEAISTVEGEKFLQRATVAITEAAKAHTEATKGEDPATRFVEILRSLFEADKAYVKDREHGTHPEDWATLGWEQHEMQQGVDIVPERRASFVGWVDDQYLYLDKNSAYAAVSSFAQRGGLPFAVRSRMLWTALSSSGINLTDPGRTDTTAWICGKSQRVVQMPRRKIFLTDNEED
jgi:hypothetical protein